MKLPWRVFSYVATFLTGSLFGYSYFVAKADNFRAVQPIAKHLSFAFQQAPFNPKNEQGTKSADDQLLDAVRAKNSEDRSELELRSLGTKNVNEGVTRERYVLHSYLQLTNVSDRTIKIEEWWVNRRRGAPLCSKTSEMEDNFSSEAAKLKRETGKDISGLFGRQLRPLQPGEFLTLDVNNDYCGSVFRVDVRTDRQTEFWTVN